MERRSSRDIPRLHWPNNTDPRWRENHRSIAAHHGIGCRSCSQGKDSERLPGRHPTNMTSSPPRWNVRRSLSLSLFAGGLLLAACSPSVPEEKPGTGSSSLNFSSAGAPVAEPTPASSVTRAASSSLSSSPMQLREIPPATGTRAACEAGCRNEYGGAGNAGFDACIRACGAGGAL